MQNRFCEPYFIDQACHKRVQCYSIYAKFRTGNSK